MNVMRSREPIVILGCGSWGTALALHCANQFDQVVMWGPFEKEVAALNADRENKQYIPGIRFPDHIRCTSALSDALSVPAIVLISVPSHVFTETIVQLVPLQASVRAMVIATKGISADGQFLHEIARQQLPHTPIALLSGPSFAKEVAQGLPTSITLACTDTRWREALRSSFHSPLFRVYPTDDLNGVAMGAVVKNVIAIAVGISEGLGFGANARAALITNGLHEMKHLIRAVGGKEETTLSLAALGDMVLTTTDNQSRNRRFGLALGQGKPLEQAEAEIGQVVEGKKNVKELLRFAKRFSIQMPISTAVYQIIFERKSAHQAMMDLLNQPI